jgi:predicted nucleic acid-binding protein
VLKLATLPTPVNPAAVIVELALIGALECWASPAMIEEYAEVLGNHSGLLARFIEGLQICHPLTELAIIRHEPDNRFLECAFAVDAEFIITVNTAKGHFDRAHFQNVRVVTPGKFLTLPEVKPLLNRLTRE